MGVKRRSSWLTEEIAEFLASCPSREELMQYRPSSRTQNRLSKLLEKSNSGRISGDEQWELDQFEHAEMLMQMIKARLRSEQVTHK